MYSTCCTNCLQWQTGWQIGPVRVYLASVYVLYNVQYLLYWMPALAGGWQFGAVGVNLCALSLVKLDSGMTFLLPSLCCTMNSTCCTVWLHWQTAGRLGLQDRSRLPHPSPSRQMPQVPLPPVWCPLELAWQEKNGVIKIYFQIFYTILVCAYIYFGFIKILFLVLQVYSLGSLKVPFKMIVYCIYFSFVQESILLLVTFSNSSIF